MSDKQRVIEAFLSKNPKISSAEEFLEKWWAPLRVSCGMPEPWSRILYFLVAKDAHSQNREWTDCKAREVHKALGIKKGYQSVILARLQKVGLVSRKMAKDDMRVRLVRVNYGVLAKLMGLSEQNKAA